MRDQEPAGLAVLMYHGVVSQPLAVSDWCFLAESEFRRQMEFLRQYTRVVPLAEGARVLAAGDESPAVALTFDDGLRCVYDVAYPILQELGLPATIFLATDFVGTDRRMWFCEVNRAIAATTHQSLDWRGETYDLSNPAVRASANARIQNRLKAHPQRVLLEALAELVEILGQSDQKAVLDDDALGVIDLKAIHDMLDSDLVELGAHSCSHAILSLLDEHEATDEIRRSVLRTSEMAGVDCRLFAYPNGRRCDYSDHAIEELRALGIEFAVSTNHGHNRSTQPPLELNRIGIGADTDFARFADWMRPFATRTS